MKTIKHRKNNRVNNKVKPLVFRSAVGLAVSYIKKVQDRANFLNSILASSTEYSIVAKDLDGNIIAWNEGARRIYGYEPEEVLGKNAALLHLQDDVVSGKVKSILDKVRKNGKWSGEINRVRKNGEKFIAYVTFTLLVDMNNNPIGFTMISRDLTEQKALEDQLKQQQNQNKLIQEATRLKNEFISNMSHELRTPLNGIIGFSELMYNEKVGPITLQHKDYLADILTSSNHLLQLINDILDLSKIDSGTLKFFPEKVSIHDLINEVNKILRSLVANKQLKLEINIPEKLPTIIIDPIKFKQIYYNLISNAIKFTIEKGIINIEVLPVKNKKFKLIIKDNGIGIKKTDLHKLFNEFQQLDPGINKKFQGTGLGLSLTRRLVEAQGGKITAKSIFGKGSIFTTILPCKPDNHLHFKKGKNLNVQLSSKAPTILVIEDEPNDQTIMRDILVAAGFSVDIADNGKEALNYINKKTYDAITLDLILPDTNGWAILEKIRTSPLNIQTPTIIISIVREKYSSFGFVINNYLTKPIEPESLVHMLVSLINNNKEEEVWPANPS